MTVFFPAAFFVFRVFFVCLRLQVLSNVCKRTLHQQATLTEGFTSQSIGKFGVRDPPLYSQSSSSRLLASNQDIPGCLHFKVVQSSLPRLCLLCSRCTKCSRCSCIQVSVAPFFSAMSISNVLMGVILRTVTN